MTTSCTYEGCTVDLTGACALERDPATCSNRLLSEMTSDSEDDRQSASDDSSIGAPVLTAPKENPRFKPSRALGIQAVEALMSQRYVTVVGILGDPESGKTACLASLYLLISHGKLEGWTFADSNSLMGFEEISRGARIWNDGATPAQLTLHTEMADDRVPGFLHLRLRRKADGRCAEFVLPDLPGEWTKELIRSSVTDRFEFLRSCEAIWIVLDGRSLSDREKRQGVITRLGQLVGRVKNLLSEKMPKLLLVVTHHDTVQITEQDRVRILNELAKHDATAQVVCVAPFSDTADVPPGAGISELVTATTEIVVPKAPFWPSSTISNDAPTYLSYRRST